MKVRILHVLTTPRAEGTPNLVLDWLSAGSGHWQGVLVLNSQPADLTDRLRAGADVYEEHDLFSIGKRKFPSFARVTYDAVRKYCPDVVVCWPTGFAGWVCAGAFAAGARRLLVHAGNPAGQSKRNRLITKYVCWPLTLLRAKVLCCSEYVRNEYRNASGIRRSLFHVVYNCTRAGQVAERSRRAASLRQPDGTFQAIMVATLEAHKDHETLLQAIPMVLAEEPGFRLKLVGSGSLREHFDRRIRTLGLENVVELLGTRSDVPELLGQSDLFVFSTTPQEGLGSVLLEALAAGLPVIATDVPACRELLQGGKWGILVKPENPREFASAIFRTIRSANDDAFRERARGYASSFTPLTMMNQYLTIAGIQ